MAFKKKGFRKRNAFRKTFRRGKGKGNVIVKTGMPRMPRGPFSSYSSASPLPVTYRCKFVYSGTYVAGSYGTNFALVGAVQALRLNSPYDPLIGVTPTSMNTSAYEFTRLCNINMYLRYKVHAVRLQVDWFDPESNEDALYGVVHVRCPSSTATIAGLSIDTCEKMPMCVVKRVSDSGSQRRRVVQYFPMNQLFGWTKQQFNSDVDSTTGPYNNDPGSVPIVELGVGDLAAATAIKYMRYTIKMTYYTTLYDRQSAI